jgi:hypothetical protein
MTYTRSYTRENVDECVLCCYTGKYEHRLSVGNAYFYSYFGEKVCVERM